MNYLHLGYYYYAHSQLMLMVIFDILQQVKVELDLEVVIKMLTGNAGRKTGIDYFQVSSN